MKFLEEKSVQYFYVFHVVFPKQDKNFANHEVDDEFNSIEFKNSSESKKKLQRGQKDKLGDNISHTLNQERISIEIY